ncbi:MAG: hypothetical protein NZ890_05815 [Myxococcota bacterium]|nr:hypothetical protein [Myxococcota bacterium]
MRLSVVLAILLATTVAGAARKEVSIAEVALAALPGWTPATGLRPTHPRFLALLSDPSAAGTRPRASRTVGFVRGSEQAVVHYLEYGTEREAIRALGELRTRLWGGEGPTPDGPRLLRVSNIIAAIESPTLSVAMAVSRHLAAAGAVQDGADISVEPEQTSGDLHLPAPPAIDWSTPAAGASDPVLQGQVAAALGKHLQSSTTCGQALRDKRYEEALSCYRRMQAEVDADPQASHLARWDAATGVGLAAAMSGRMPEAREAFLRAIKPALHLDLRKLAETYFNFACAEAELGNKTGALQAIKGLMSAARRAGPERLAHYRQLVQTDNSLRSLRGDPRLKKLLAGK